MVTKAPAKKDYTTGDVGLLLRRCGFANTTREVDALSAKHSWADVVDAVLDTSANPPDTVPSLLADGTAPKRRAWVEAVHYWMDRMVTTPTPAVEKVTLFWHGLLTSAIPKPPPNLVFEQIRTWRRLGLGDIHTLMQAMAVDPAMLVYLNNASNVVAQPNENFARELMELFTMGNRTFTEADVVAMARAWTGHNYARRSESYRFRARQHDDGSKTLFGHTRNWDGPEALTDILRGSRQEVSARYLAGRIWSAFAAPRPKAVLLDELAAALIHVDLDMTAFLRVVFTRPEFRAEATRTGLVRSPVEWQVAAMRGAALRSADVRPERWMAPLGQILYQPPNVSGWRQNEAWISSSAMWAKADFAAVVARKMKQAGNLSDLGERSADEQVASVLSRFGVDRPSTPVRTQLERYAAGEVTAGRRSHVAVGLVALALLSPDFQLA